MAVIDVIEPATEQVIESLEQITPAELEDVIARATVAQRQWAAQPPQFRAEVLLAIAAAVDNNREALAQLEARNVGMPISDARGAISGVAATFRYYAAAPERLLGQTIPVAGGVDMTFREPIGVVGLITPWNYPLTIAAWKVAPALAAGNAVVLKPAELTPLTSLRLAQLAVEAGLPSDLFNVVVGPGRTIGSQLVEHPGVGKIAFTGSTDVGKDIARRAADGIKRVTLELGGKSAALVFADADLDAAAEGLTGAVFGNSGQDCCARSRVFVERSALDAFLEKLEKVVANIIVGDPLSDNTQMGPLISAGHAATVQSYVDDAPVLFRGSAPTGPGFWFAPTVLHPIDDDHRSAREEIFGPVVSVLTFDSEDEAVTRANDTIYGLAGSIWTSNAARSLRVARGVAAGALAVNSYTSVRIATPFGGFKQSGMGRELGPDALDAYTEVKNVFFNTTAP
ncbi:aldehyde dehydrogenase family protein [Mycolicibacterium brisbanense]|uniref:Betaine-aldehyde dehydrogenase n=1 Tax=Mycolicibacterium brisbanense TaxID=146020 RepID=A0A117I878_9MYCO|nr:aldehyde dehydrogenase family protein [Mycolicibacterium brisbanense]MCV7162153.1 aldehyde dehydrogenase [Mycolicibacterium brisbanense]GAS92792.1 betaine-aldehyde dehydrogenase [Mycolicibacterium brisbanense]